MDAQNIVDRLNATIDPSKTLKARQLSRWVLTLLHGVRTRNKAWSTAAIQSELYDNGSNPHFNAEWPLVQVALFALSAPTCGQYDNLPASTGPGALIMDVAGVWKPTPRFAALFPGASAQEIPLEAGPMAHFYYEIVIGGFKTRDDITKRTETSKGETIKPEEVRIFILGARVTKKDGAPILTGISIDRILNAPRPAPGGVTLPVGKYEPRSTHLYGVNNLEINGQDYAFTPEERAEMARIEAIRQSK